MFDYHLHSSFSIDCPIPMEQMIEAAIQKGLTEICFTEHIDYDYPYEEFIFDFDKQQYATKIKDMQQQYEGRIRIKKGVEIGVQPHILEQYKELMDKETFDFIICSMHTVEKKACILANFSKTKPSKNHMVFIMENYYTVSKTINNLIFLDMLILSNAIRNNIVLILFMMNYERFSTLSFLKVKVLS